MLCKLISHTDRSRFNMQVISLLPEGKITDTLRSMGIPVFSLGISSSFGGFASLCSLRKILLEISPHILQGWMYHGNLAAWVGKKMIRGRMPVVWNVRHSLHRLSDEKRGTSAIIRCSAMISNSVDHILYNSETSRIQHELIGYSAAYAETIPNGFDTDSFRPNQEARFIVREELGLPKDTPLVGLIARFDPLKGHDFFLKAAGIVAGRHQNVNFLLAGRDVSLNNAAIKNLVYESGLENRIHLLGERDDIPLLTAALDVAVSSSISEAFANAIGEAMSCGIACVVTNVGDSAKLTGSFGLVVPPGDSNRLAEGIASLLDIGPDGRSELGKGARNRIMQSYSIDAITTCYEKVYAELADHAS